MGRIVANANCQHGIICQYKEILRVNDFIQFDIERSTLEYLR